MSLTSIKKFSVAVGLLSFTLIFFGSWFNGARVITSFVRGVEGFAVFALVCWLILRGWIALNSEKEKDKGINLDQTV